ncbi:MAG: glycosyltransferase family 2 protein [Cyanobacteria bacterium P01_E01_bin.34]
MPIVKLGVLSVLDILNLSLDHTELLAVAGSLVGLGGLAWKLYFALTSAPHLQAEKHQQSKTAEGLSAREIAETNIVIIVPAYNEELNVCPCLTSILDSTPSPIRVILADDSSTDATAELADQLRQERADVRLSILRVPSRPEHERWVGKNWACNYTVQQLASSAEGLPDYLLFLDCDVTLEPGALEAAISLARQQQVGLLTIAPEIVCGCFAEWLVQPIMMASMAGWFEPSQVNDDKCADAFAAGPFMLFERSAYLEIGGHSGVRECVVEDVELASAIKRHNLGLQFTYSGSLVKLRMYRDAAQLWEGWTKNAFEAVERNWLLWLFAVVALGGLFLVPWVVGILGLITSNWLLLVLAISAITFHLLIRLMLRKWANLPLTYWWLSGAGGLVTIAIFLTSAYRTTTGRNWTWKGRSLQ